MYSTALELWLPPDSCEVLITSEVKDVILSCQRLLLGNIEACRVEPPNQSCFVSDNHRIHHACKESSVLFEL